MARPRTHTICTGLIADESMRHGYISRDERNIVRLTHETYLALQDNECMQRTGEYLMAQPPGTYLIPMSFLRPDDVEELQRGLAIVDPEPSEVCIYPPCILPTVTVRDGFPLCEEHDALLRGWDDLVA